MTLDGTNTWVIAEPGSPTAAVVDPGPDDEEHLRRVLDVAGAGDRRVTQIVRPASPDESWRFTYAAPEGGERMAFVRSDVGLVLGTTRAGGPMETLKELHSLAFFGPLANALTEIAAGWAIVLVLSGFYLWWPRAGNRALSLAGRVGERRFWRNLHGSTGALAGVVILSLFGLAVGKLIGWLETRLLYWR